MKREEDGGLGGDTHASVSINSRKYVWECEEGGGTWDGEEGRWGTERGTCARDGCVEEQGGEEAGRVEKGER